MSVTQESYGDLPGVHTIVIGGGLAGTAVGREIKLVLFGRGDPDSGNASPNDPTQIDTRTDAQRMFGTGSELAEQILHALENKGNIDYIYGVMPAESDVSAETVAGDGGTLSNNPIVEDPGLITVTNTTSETTVTPEFHYESPPPTPDTADTMFINPLTGEAAGDTSDDFEVDYSYLDWEAALDSADQVLNHREVGIYAPLTDSHAVADLLDTKLTGTDADDGDNGIRGESKLAAGVIGAEPNMMTEAGEPGIDADAYSDAIDNAAIFVPGIVRRSGESNVGSTILGGIAGRFAGNELNNPIYGDSVGGYGRLTQSFSRSDRETLRNKQVIPVHDDYRDGGGGITLDGHLSSSTATDWHRSFQNRRIVDLIVLAQREIGEAARTNLLIDDQLDEIEAQLLNVFDDFARQGLIRGNPDDQDAGGGGGTGGGTGGGGAGGDDEQQQTYFAEARRGDTETIAVASGFSPVPVITGVEETIQVADQLGDLTTAETQEVS